MRTVYFVIILIGLSVFSGLAAFGEVSSRSIYPLVGTIIQIDRKGARATIAHEAIPRYMPAMTMEFTLLDCGDLSRISQGDRIQGRLVTEGDHAWIEDVHVLQVSNTLTSVPASSFPELAEGSLVPEIKLTTSAGEFVQLSQFRGRSIALTFIYTRCPMPGYCPLINRNFQVAEKMIKASGNLSEYLFLSITIDPAYDTPGVLAAFSKKWEVEPASWIFATGEPSEIKAFGRAFGLTSNQSDEAIHHTLRTVVISPAGKVWRTFKGNTWKPDMLVTELLLSRKDSASPLQKPSER